MAQPTLTEAVKTRISEELKGLIRTEAESRELDESDVVREALREYFAQHGDAKPKNRKGLAK